MRKTCLALVAVVAFPALLTAQEPKFIRLKEDKDKTAALEVAITRYTNNSKTVTVDLVGVVHIADRAYYRQLNKRFPKYDVVLYELVAPPGTRVPASGKTGSSAGFLTTLMTTFLDLDSQLACIDYQKKNFVHADLSFDGMMAAAKKRGETGWTLGMSVLVEMMRQQNLSAMKPGTARDDDGDFLTGLFNPKALKRQMARQLASTADLGPTLQALLVSDRNKKTCEVLTEQIEDGKQKIAIFYGAAHMPDFDKRLRTEFGLRRQGQEWLTAWDLRQGPGAPSRKPKAP